jgi:hypothetical protein
VKGKGRSEVGVMLDKTKQKLELKRTKAEAAKIEVDATMIKALNEASQLAVTKMVKGAKILMTNMMNFGPKRPRLGM